MPYGSMLSTFTKWRRARARVFAPVFYDRTYWLAPDGEPARRPYALLVHAMEDRHQVGIGTVVMRNKQYLGPPGPAIRLWPFRPCTLPTRWYPGLTSRRLEVAPRQSLGAGRVPDASEAHAKMTVEGPVTPASRRAPERGGAATKSGIGQDMRARALERPAQQKYSRAGRLRSQWVGAVPAKGWGSPC